MIFEYCQKAIEKAQYKKLEELTRDTYRYSNTYHGRQQVPWNRVYQWSQLVERYEQELDLHLRNIKSHHIYFVPVNNIQILHLLHDI